MNGDARRRGLRARSGAVFAALLLALTSIPATSGANPAAAASYPATASASDDAAASEAPSSPAPGASRAAATEADASAQSGTDPTAADPASAGGDAGQSGADPARAGADGAQSADAPAPADSAAAPSAGPMALSGTDRAAGEVAMRCVYADDGAGPLSDRLCWLDFAGLNLDSGTSLTGAYSKTIPISVGVGTPRDDGTYDYTLSANLVITASNANQARLNPVAFPTYGQAFLGNSGFYTMKGADNSMARPALNQITNAATVTISLQNAFVWDNVWNMPAPAFSLVTADAESTDNNEWMRWDTSGGGGFTELRNSASSLHGNACAAQYTVTSNSVYCAGQSSTKTGTVMLSATPPAAYGAPWSVSQTIKGGGRGAVAFAVQVSRGVRSTTTVTDRVFASDSFAADADVTIDGRLDHVTKVMDQGSKTVTAARSLLMTPPSYAAVTAYSRFLNTANQANYRTASSCAYRNGTPIADPKSFTVDVDQSAKCEFLHVPSYLQMNTVVDNRAGGTAGPDRFTLTASGADANGTAYSLSGASGIRRAAPASASLALTSSPMPGYALASLVCTSQALGPKGELVAANPKTSVLNWTAALDADGNPIPGQTPASLPPSAPGANIDCTFTQVALPGTVAWHKVDDSTPAKDLSGSEWTLIGPDGKALTVADCAAATPEACTGPDTDHRAGYFLVKGRPWGTSTLKEQASPAGFLLDETPRSFAITGERLDYAFPSAFVNRKTPIPALPLTGGPSADAWWIAGGLAAALALGLAAFGRLRRPSA